MIWQLEAEHPQAHALLDDLGPLALSLFGTSVQALFASREEAECARRRLATHLGLAPSLHELPARDWVAENIRSFAPLVVGPFTIVQGDGQGGDGQGGDDRGGDDRGGDDRSETAGHLIRMRAGTGFGTGEHPTTAGCLEALAGLDAPPRRVLDMGCGSAILSIAAAVLWDCHVIAVDNDPLALAFARRQVADNGLASRIHFACASAFSAFSLTHFDLVVANILARPLIDMAPAINATAVILSGCLEHQCARVLDAYRQAGYAPRTTSITGGWATITLTAGQHPETSARRRRPLRQARRGCRD